MNSTPVACWNEGPLQYSGLQNSMDCLVHGATKSQTRPSDFHSTNEFIFEGGNPLSSEPCPLSGICCTDQN